MAMLKHEETFKEQVCELHRLYRIQKALMGTVVDGDRHRGRSDHQRLGLTLDLEQVPENQDDDDDDDGEIELTLGLSSYCRRPTVKKPGNLLGPDSDSGRSFSSSSTGSSHAIGVDVAEEQMRRERWNQPPWLFQREMR